MNKIFLIVPLWMLATVGSPTLVAESPRIVDLNYLNGLRAEVRTNHPTVAAAQARVRAAEAGILAVRLWEDPMAGVSIMAADRNMRRDDGDFMVMGDQVLPRRGLFRALKTRAKAERDVSQAEKLSAILNLEMMVGQAAVELALVDETLLIQSNQIAWLESMTANAREKLKDPAATAAEPLRLEAELAQERQRFDALLRRRTSLVRQLNTILGRPVDEAWSSLVLPDNLGATPLLSIEIDRLAATNPMLQALASTMAVAKAELEMARRERKPMFSVGAESRFYSGGDFRETTVGAKMTFPWFNNSVYRANIDRARQQEVAAQQDYQALERRLLTEIMVAYTDAENSARQAATLSKDVLPRMEKAAQAIESSWISTRATLLEVLEARRALLSARLELRRSIAAFAATLETLRNIIPPPEISLRR